jgi:hypothetical protein
MKGENGERRKKSKEDRSSLAKKWDHWEREGENGKKNPPDGRIHVRKRGFVHTLESNSSDLQTKRLGKEG